MLIIAGCGDSTTTTTSPGAGAETRHTATATILESPDHGPQLCLGAVLDSLPPQCGGPDIVNWDWEEVDGAESAAGTTWGEYTVVGTYDGETFTLTEPPSPPRVPDFDQDPLVFPTPCDEPTDGWVVVDESTTTDEALYAAIDYASAKDDHAGTWLDQSINPAMSPDADLGPEEIELLANDPTKLILNVRFTGDLDHHEQELRAIWGGALCVSLAEHTEAELLDIQRQLHENFDGVLGSGIDSVTGQVQVEVIVDDGTLQAELDSRYGAGLITIQAALRPVD